MGSVSGGGLFGWEQLFLLDCRVCNLERGCRFSWCFWSSTHRERNSTVIFIFMLR